MEIPEPLPFNGVQIESVPVPRYRSTFDIVALLEGARQELATSQLERYKILLPSVMAGLRRNEIDVLPWTAFRWNEGDTHRDDRALSSEVAQFRRRRRVDPELMEVFRVFFARRKRDFVIESDSPPPAFDAPYGIYRCHGHMRALPVGLPKGVICRTPLHALRKEFGSLINARTAFSPRVNSCAMVVLGSPPNIMSRTDSHRSRVGPSPHGRADHHSASQRSRFLKSEKAGRIGHTCLSHEETSFSHFDRFVFGLNVVRSWRAGRNSVSREDAEGEGSAYRRGRQEIP